MSNRIGRTRIVGSSGVHGLSSGWFGYGQDGELNIPENQDVELPVESDIGYIRKCYTNLTIGKGATLRPSARNNSTILLVKGDLVVDGTIDVSRCAPLKNDAEAIVQRNAHIILANSSAENGELVGGNGGCGGLSDKQTSGLGGKGFWCGGGYGGGGSSAINGFWGGNSEPRPPYGLSEAAWYGTFVSTRVPQQYGCGGCRGTAQNGALGGRGPGGSPAYHTYVEDARWDTYVDEIKPGYNGNAYGGGAIWIYVQGNVTINPTGKILANGGMGASGTSDYTHVVYDLGNGYYETNRYKDQPLGSGGSGGGGIIFIAYGGVFSNYGTIEAAGGAQPSAGSEACRGQAGDAGTVKTIWFEDLMKGN